MMGGDSYTAETARRPPCATRAANQPRQPNHLWALKALHSGKEEAWTPPPRPRQKDPHACRHMVGWPPDRVPLHALLTFAPGASNNLEGTEYFVLGEIPPSQEFTSPPTARGAHADVVQLIPRSPQSVGVLLELVFSSTLTINEHRPTTLVLPIPPFLVFARFAGPRFCLLPCLASLCPLPSVEIGLSSSRSHRDLERHSASSLCRSWEACESAGQSSPINHHVCHPVEPV